MNKFIALIILSFVFNACQFNPKELFSSKPKKEHVKEYYPSGKLKAIHELVGEKRHGVSKHYFENGKLKAIMHYNMNQREGERIGYYQNGKVRTKANYINNRVDGKGFGYYENGSIYLEEEYVNGLLEGIKRKYYKNGKLQMENLYHLGQPSSELKEYDRYGRLIKNYPPLKVNKRKLGSEGGIYLLDISFDGRSKNESFYIDELIDGKFLPQSRQPLEVIDGKAKYRAMVQPLDASTRKISVIGTMVTMLGHTRIVSTQVNL